MIKAGLLLNRSRQVPAEETPAFGGIAERFRRAGDLDRAVTLCREGLRKFPTLLSARVTLGWALLDKGDYDEARAELEQVLRRAPDNLAAIRGLAELHERTDHLRSSQHDIEQDIDLESLTAAIAAEERAAAEETQFDEPAVFEAAAPESTLDYTPTPSAYDDAPVSVFAEVSDMPAPADGFTHDDSGAGQFPAAFSADAIPAAFDIAPDTGAFAMADAILTSPSDFAAAASTTDANFYAAEPVVLSLNAEPISVDAPATAFTLEESAVEPVSLSLIANADAVSAFESSALDPVAPAFESDATSLAFSLAAPTAESFDEMAKTSADLQANFDLDDQVVTLPASGELEFDDLATAMGAFSADAPVSQSMPMLSLPDDPPLVVEAVREAAAAHSALDSDLDSELDDVTLHLAALADTESHAKPSFDDIAPVEHGRLADPEMAGAFDHDFGLAAERAEDVHDYDLPDGDTTWAPEQDVRLAAFSSLPDGFNGGLGDEFDGPNVIAMASRTPIPKFSTAGLERLLCQVQARRVALATSSVA